MIISYDIRYRFYAMIDYILVNLQPFEKMYRNHIMGSEGERIWILIRIRNKISGTKSRSDDSNSCKEITTGRLVREDLR